MSQTKDLNDLTKAELRDEVRRLRGELKATTSGVSRRNVIRGGLGVTSLAALLFASDPVAAAPGVYPIESEPPFVKIRAERIRYDTRTSQPSAPASGRVLSYVDDGDLP